MAAKKFPTTQRNARRSLKFEPTADGRVIVGSYWLKTRIIGDTHEQVTQAALNAWANGGETPS